MIAHFNGFGLKKLVLKWLVETNYKLFIKISILSEIALVEFHGT